MKLNAVDLAIFDVTYEQTVDGEKRAVKASSHDLYEETQVLSLSFPRPLVPGEVTLIMMYTGKVSERKKGFFKSTYKAADGGEERYAFATHFEPDMARHCFPCMDEPSLKATFQLSLVVPKNRIGLSNMVRMRMRIYPTYI